MLSRMAWSIKIQLGKFRRQPREEDGKLRGESKSQETWPTLAIKSCHVCFRIGVKDTT